MVDRLTGPDPRAWLVELRTTFAPVSVAGYVRKFPDALIEPVPQRGETEGEFGSARRGDRVATPGLEIYGQADT